MDVIILAGGLGTRLREVVQDQPKPMAPVAGHPFLYHIFAHLDLDLVDRIILSVGYRYEQIKSYFGREYLGKEILYAVEQEPMGTGGGIKLALSKCRTAQVLILNGDTFVELDLHAMLAHHRNTESALTLAAKHLEHPTRYGCLALDGTRIIGFIEKDPKRKQGYINAGVYIFERKTMKHFPSEERFSFEKDFLEAKVADLHFEAFETNGLFIDIGIPQDYERAQELF